GAAGLVVPDVEGAVGRLVDSIDASPQTKMARSSERDLDGFCRSERGVEPRAGKPERNLEIPRGHLPAMLLLLAQERSAGDRDRVPAQSEGRRAPRRDA